MALLLLGITAVNGVSFLYPQFLQSVKDLSPLHAGLWLIPITLASVLGSLVAPSPWLIQLYSNRHGKRSPPA